MKAAGEKMDSDLHEMSKPLTRGVDDEDRENHLKDVEHADDPMLQYMRKKRSKAEGKTKTDLRALGRTSNTTLRILSVHTGVPPSFTDKVFCKKCVFAQETPVFL